MPGREVDGGKGSALTMAAISAERVLPENGRPPVIISYRSTPNEKMSVRVSTSSPSICSGAMYGSVPSRSPSPVS